MFADSWLSSFLEDWWMPFVAMALTLPLVSLCLWGAASVLKMAFESLLGPRDDDE